MFTKVLVANRGQIAVRAFRAAYELGAGTVAAFPWDYRNSVRRLKADESYQIGEVGHPVRPPRTLVWRPPHVVPFVRGS
jgi:pyruvate carboxylase